ncbi:class I SAM-dependent methyltransferase [Phototrophicus methaneseepsis]|uniref:Class I SAM-dependent methyltransferase n=1 Tax=Phototrophicus methaneseepsis TaxID=2710758 RepID=A0A7S8IDP9_9CHLR|nr:class I SAM-dependent methyltransferase [Phototrophicus methaneseepsis]QPC81762.1 class I SAM-dependent methyltransferase [Phototrophicus methaneseepsis]
MMVSQAILKDMALRVGQREGWDFSRVRDQRDPVPWDYEQVVVPYLSTHARVLDIGTGGGERLLKLLPLLGSAVGVDADEAMIQTAQANARSAQQYQLSFRVMRSEKLLFDDNAFDVVLCRHAPYDVGEVLRVLKPGAVFITQQVGWLNTANIYRAFGQRPQHNDGTDPYKMGRRFKAAGCDVLVQASYDVPYRFLDVESLIFWLQAVPVPSDFAMETHWQGVQDIIQRYSTSRGIETNEHRTLLVVRRR